MLFSERKQSILGSGRAIPRLPLEGNIDLTYRCNCNCRHCWLRLPANHRAEKQELSFDDIDRIVGEARAMGCRKWLISGGEPMLRADFADIFDMITRRSLPYSLNTNGTLITPTIARLLRRRGAKMVALYGATAEIHDHITRTPGSFAATMQGFAYLREAKAGFIVQLIPMRDNHHQFDAMVRLARSLSPVYRVGAPWLYLSACRSAVRNLEISRQRLNPADVIRIEPPDTTDDDEAEASHARQGARLQPVTGSPFFAACIEEGRDFHVDPYGGMTFCPFVKDPALRYDLRKGTFREGWDKFIPSLADKVVGDPEYEESCGACEWREDCRWCPAYAYLEEGRYSAKVTYLCALAREARSYRESWQRDHRRYYRIAGITIRLDSDLPFAEDTFDPKFKKFETDGPAGEMISLRHHFSIPEEFDRHDTGQEIYRRPPWAIYRKDRSWIYLSIGPGGRDEPITCAAAFDEGHTRGRIYNGDEARFRHGNLHSLTMFPSDQIVLARALADRQACLIHAAGVDIGGKGVLLVGHSGAGKTTAARMMRTAGEVLCDDRIIVRRWPEGLRIHGTWSNGELADVSAGSAPLSGVLFLQKADVNRLVPMTKMSEIAQLLAQYVVRSVITADWWEKILTLLETVARETPAYCLQFDKGGRMPEEVMKIL